MEKTVNSEVLAALMDGGDLTPTEKSYIPSASEKAWLTSFSNIGIRTTADLNLYVRSTGSDSNSGLTVDAPLLTIQAAINKIPKRIDHAVVVDIGAGTFAPITVEGFHIGRQHTASPTNGFLINGTMGQPTLATGTASGTSTGGADRQLTDAGQAWTVNELRGMFLKIGTNYRVIRSNTATQLTLAGNITGGYNAKAYEILESKTVIQGSSSYSAAVLSRNNFSSVVSQNNTGGYVLSYLKVDARFSVVGAYTTGVAASYGSSFGMNVCQFLGGGSSDTTAVISCFDWPSQGPSFTDCAIISPDKGDGLDIVRCQGLFQCDRVFVYNAPKIGVRVHQIPAMCNFGELYIDTVVAGPGLRATGCAWVDVDYADIQNCAGAAGAAITLDNSASSLINFSAYTHLNLTAGVLSNNAAGGILGTNGTIIDLKGCSGTGNGGYGVALTAGSRLGVNTVVTLTGSSGDLVINNGVTPLTWAGYLANNGDIAVALNTRCVAERIAGGGAGAAKTTWLTKDGFVLPPLREVRNATEPTLVIGDAVLWVDQDDSDNTYLVFRNSQNLQKKIQLA